MRSGKFAAAAVLAFTAGQAEAATWLRYTVLGVGTETDYDYRGSAIETRGPVPKLLIVSFVIDVDQYPTSTYTFGFPDYGLVTTSASIAGNRLTASGTRGESKFTTGFQLDLSFTGGFPENAFPRSFSTDNVTGTLSAYASYSLNFVSQQTFTAAISRIGVEQVAAYGPFQISAIPEPATWAMMIVGVGAIGAGARRSRRLLRVA